MAETLPEYWLRGPVEGVPAIWQPVAHALLQAVDEIKALHIPDAILWERPAGVASPGFHLLHIKGVLDRLSTYAQGRSLTDAQLRYLREETVPQSLSATELIRRVEEQVNSVIAYLKATPDAEASQPRGVGRKGLPSTVQGLLFHAAEHTMRHLGQLLVTVRILVAES